MKKRSFYAIVLVAIGLFLSINLGSFAVNFESNSHATGNSGGGNNNGSSLSGVYIPD